MAASTRRNEVDIPNEAPEGVEIAKKLHQRADAFHNEADKVYAKAKSMHERISAMRQQATSREGVRR